MFKTMTKPDGSLCEARKVALYLLLILIPLTYSVRESSALSPRWEQYYDALYYTVGDTPGVTVQEPYEYESGTWTIDVVVKDQKTRVALATLLREHPPGDEPPYTVTIRVVDGMGTEQTPLPIIGTTEAKLAELKYLALVAFQQNPNVFKIETLHSPFQTGVYIIIMPFIAQFFTDDLSDFYGRSTYTLTNLFTIVLEGEISGVSINSSTKPLHSP